MIKILERLNGTFVTWFDPSSTESRTLQRARDQQLIERINEMIYAKMKTVSTVFEKSFSGTPLQAIEREAAHAYWIRVFIHESGIPIEATAFIKTLREDEKRVCLAYLSAIDQGRELAKSKYPDYYPRIEDFERKFLSEADKDERDYYAARQSPLPSTSIEGNRVRPMDGTERIPLGPKVQRHPVTSLMLGEFRRALYPRAQVGVDAHFHALNMQSRPKEIEKMREGPKTISQAGEITITTYHMPVQIEFFPDRTSTENPGYLSHIQGEGTLTTQGVVQEYSLRNGKSVYLIRYKDYKTTPIVERFLVSEEIPVGRKGDAYKANLDFETAHFTVREYLNRS